MKVKCSLSDSRNRKHNPINLITNFVSRKQFLRYCHTNLSHEFVFRVTLFWTKCVTQVLSGDSFGFKETFINGSWNKIRNYYYPGRDKSRGLHLDKFQFIICLKVFMKIETFLCLCLLLTDLFMTFKKPFGNSFCC